MLTSPRMIESPAPFRKPRNPLPKDVVHLVDLNGGDQRAEHGVENSPGVPDHHVDGIRLPQLADPRDGNEREHQRADHVKDGTKQGVKETEHDHREGIEKVSNHDRTTVIVAAASPVMMSVSVKEGLLANCCWSCPIQL